MTELFQLIMDNPLNALLAATSGMAAFGVTIKTIGFIIDIFGRARKRLNRKLDRIESVAAKVLAIADTLGMDSVKETVTQIHERTDKALDKLRNLEFIENTLMQMVAFMDTVKGQWDSATRIKFEQAKLLMLSNGVGLTTTNESPEPSVKPIEVSIAESDHAQPVGQAQKTRKRIKIKEVVE